MTERKRKHRYPVVENEDEKFEKVLELISYGVSCERAAKEVFGFRTWTAVYKRLLKRPDIYERYQYIRATSPGKRPQKATDGQKWMSLFELIANGWFLKDAAPHVFGMHRTTINRKIKEDPNKMAIYEKAKVRQLAVREREARKRHIARNKEAHRRMMADPEKHALELQKRRTKWSRYTDDKRFRAYINAADKVRRRAKIDNTPFSELKKKWVVPPSWRWMGVNYGGDNETTETERQRDGREVWFINKYVVDEILERRSRKYDRSVDDTRDEY